MSLYRIRFQWPVGSAWRIYCSRAHESGVYETLDGAQRAERYLHRRLRGVVTEIQATVTAWGSDIAVEEEE